MQAPKPRIPAPGNSRVSFPALLAPIALAMTAALSLPGCGGPKYVKVPLDIPSGKTSGLSDAERAADSLMRALVSNPAAVRYFDKMFKTAVVEIQEFDSLTFTVKIVPEGDSQAKAAKAEYVLGTDTSAHPDLVLPLHLKNLENVVAIFADGEVSDEEAYRIHRATFGSNLRSLFQVPALYDPKVARYLDLPDFIHMTLKNERGYEFLGSRKEATVTILNVDGQWLVSHGALGDPDLKWEVTPERLREFSRLVYEPGKGAATSKDAARARLKEIKAFLDAVTVYRRQ